MKAGSIGISIRHPHAGQTPAQHQPTEKPAETAEPAEQWEDYIINERDLDYYWREFAARLPKEESANAGRMMNMHPHLMKDQTTFEIVVDNEMVQKYMQQLAPQIEQHLRRQLHNRRIKMALRVSAPGEQVRAYSHAERFAMMSKKNPKLLKLRDTFGLELS